MKREDVTKYIDRRAYRYIHDGRMHRLHPGAWQLLDVLLESCGPYYQRSDCGSQWRKPLATLGYLVQRTGQAPRTIKRSFQELKRAGLVQVDQDHLGMEVPEYMATIDINAIEVWHGMQKLDAVAETEEQYGQPAESDDTERVSDTDHDDISHG
jgi:hypothetical protein